MKSMRIGLVVMVCYLLFGAIWSQSADIASKVSACFPKAPSGYLADEVQIEPGLSGSLMQYFNSGKSVDQDYYDDRGEELMAMIEIVSTGLETHKYALDGQNPGCRVIDVFGRKGVVMYDLSLDVMVANKVVVIFSGADDFSQDKDLVMRLAKKFDFNSLESLLN